MHLERITLSGLDRIETLCSPGDTGAAFSITLPISRTLLRMRYCKRTGKHVTFALFYSVPTCEPANGLLQWRDTIKGDIMQEYRILQKGELIIPTDEAELDEDRWYKTVLPGTRASNPAYTFNIRYRRKITYAKGSLGIGE